MLLIADHSILITQCLGHPSWHIPKPRTIITLKCLDTSVLIPIRIPRLLQLSCYTRVGTAAIDIQYVYIYPTGDFLSVFPSVFAETSQYEKFAQNDASSEDDSNAVIPFGLFWEYDIPVCSMWSYCLWQKYWFGCRPSVLKFQELWLWQNLRGSLAELTENFCKLIAFLKFAWP
jgi:hypothetical protein